MRIEWPQVNKRPGRRRARVGSWCQCLRWMLDVPSKFLPTLYPKSRSSLTTATAQASVGTTSTALLLKSCPPNMPHPAAHSRPMIGTHELQLHVPSNFPNFEKGYSRLRAHHGDWGSLWGCSSLCPVLLLGHTLLHALESKQWTSQSRDSRITPSSPTELLAANTYLINVHLYCRQIERISYSYHSITGEETDFLEDCEVQSISSKLTGVRYSLGIGKKLQKVHERTKWKL